MGDQREVPNGVIFLVLGTGIVTTARAMTLSFLAIKLQQTFDLGPATIGFLLGLGPLMGAFASPIIGSLSDRQGRRVVLTVVLVSLAFAMLGLGLAETVLVFCIAQSLAAIAISIYTPISRALISDACPEPLRLKYFSWRYTASNIGWAIGPLLGIAAGVASTFLFLAGALIYATLALAMQLVSLRRVDCAGGGVPSEAPSMVAGIVAAIRVRRLLCYIGASTLLVAVDGQWSATLAP